MLLYSILLLAVFLVLYHCQLGHSFSTTFSWPEPSQGWQSFLRDVDEQWYRELERNRCQVCGECFDYSGNPKCQCSRKRIRDDMPETLMDSESDPDLLENPAKRAHLSSGAGMDDEEDEIARGLRGTSAGSGGVEGRSVVGGGGEAGDPTDIATLLKKQFSVMRKDMRDMLSKNTELMKAEVNTQIKAEIAPLSASMAELQSTQTKQANEIKELQMQLRGQGSDNASISSTRVSTAPWRPYEPHVPTWIQVSGFCKVDPRKIETRDQSKVQLQTVRNMLAKLYSISQARDQGDASIFDKARTEQDLSTNKFGVTRFRVYFVSGTPKATIWEVRKEWSEAWIAKSPDLMCENAFGPYRDQHLGWLVQPAPQDRTRVAETRKATAQFHKKKTVGTATVTFEAEGPTKAWMYALRDANSERKCIGSWTSSVGWKLSPSQLQLIDPGLDASVWEGMLNGTQ